MTNAPDAGIILGSVFAPPEALVTRLLVTRHWPRGVPRGAVDQWEPRLGPSPELLASLAGGTIDAARFAEAYRAQILERPSLLDWVGRMISNNGVVLLCASCDPQAAGDMHEAPACHLPLLATVLRERIGVA